MPRTRRTPASETPAQDAAPVETPPVASDAPSAEDSSQNAVTNDAAGLTSPIQLSPTQDAAPKPPRRRGTRQPKAEAAPVSDAPPPAAETAPPRRRGRRTSAPEPTESASVASPLSSSAAPEGEASAAAPVAETAPPRRRGRRTNAPETFVSSGPAAEAPAAPDLEAPIAESSGEAAASVRRRGRRTGASETPASPQPSSSQPDAEAPAAQSAPAETPARRRGRSRPADTPLAESVSPPAPETPAPTPPSRRRGQPRPAPASAADAPDVTQTSLPEPAAPLPEAAVPLPEIVAEAAEGTPQEETQPTRRRGRRGAAAAEVLAAPPAPSLLELPDVEAPVEPSVSGEEPDDAEADKRGRRSRRSRRRRGGVDEPTTEMLEAAGAGLLLDDIVVEPVAPEEEEEETFLAYPPPAPPVYVAPRLVPPVLPPADAAAAPRLTAFVRHEGRGLPQIEVNGKGCAPYFFFVNAETATDGETVDAQIRQAAEAGIHLFSGVMYLPFRNAYGDRSFGAIDALVQQILAADPDGFILPRLQFFPTNYWARTHADQMARYAGGEEGDVSLASTEFWSDCVDALEALMSHFADPSTVGGDRVLGFHLDRGEWFYDADAGYDVSPPNTLAFGNWLHAKYQALHALRAAWHDADITWEEAAVPEWQGRTASVKKTDTALYAARREGRWPDYAQYSSELVAGIIGGLAEAIKTLSLGRMIVAASYGYTLEFAGRNDSGHLALGKLLQSPHIDIVAGPNAYAGRGAGSPAAFGAPLDSVALHGKLWLVEDDTKTFLADVETDDTYNPKIASGADTQAIHQRHFGAALAHRAGVTWMDLWGQGWLNSPDIWRELGGLAAQSAKWGRLVPSPPPSPDVVVLVDEASLRFLKNDANGLGTHLVGRTRDLLLRAGASVGFYLQSDVTRPNFPDAKLYLFLNALRLTTEERTAVREKLQRSGKTLAWLYAPGVFDENGPSSEDVGEVVGLALRRQPWNSRGGSVATEGKHPITERIRGTRKIGQEEILNPLYAVSDPQATVIAEYASTGATSLATREHKGGWKSVFFGDPYLTIELLRGLYAYANVPVYDGQDDAVYAGADGSLTIHGSFTGQRTISLPRRASVYDVFDDKIIAANTRSFRAFVRARTTRLFLWGEGRELAAATGLDLPAQSAEAADTPAVSEPPAVSPPPRSSRETPLAEPPPLADAAEDILAGFDTSPAPTGPVIALLESQAVTMPGEESEEDDLGSETAEGEEGGDANAPARRSRWQRRRAAARARRDAERAAQLAAGPDAGNAAGPPVDIATLLPGLPPRRTPAPLSVTSEAAAESFSIEEVRVEEFSVDIAEDTELAFGEPVQPAPADRIAGILAADIADDDPQDIPAATVSRPDGFDGADSE